MGRSEERKKLVSDVIIISFAFLCVFSSSFHFSSFYHLAVVFQMQDNVLKGKKNVIKVKCV